ncbi:MAG: HAMP domain-containing histidine kinase [Alphaproteobacteria bacterium]|nr:HAMP domain-containing histidine kinase [Alphaproteobacteria bacterium]
MAQPSLERRLVGRLVWISTLATALGFAGLLLKSYRMAAGLSDEGQADVFVAEFLKEAAWTFPLFVAGVITLVVLTVRSSLQPLRDCSRQAERIGPDAPGLRLGLTGLPSEVASLVSATNLALDRLEQGFDAQRQFTALAAHELRTPLAILTAGLESLPPSAEVRALRADAARMGRLVEQLLRMARLDALPHARKEPFDLSAWTADVVAQLGPWAVAEGRRLAYEGPGAPVPVLADADGLEAALRNLIENAIHHSPSGSEVLVRVDAKRGLQVIDRGPGVSPGIRPLVCQRFWRGPGRRGPGAGLGLAIVDEVARAHGAALEIADTDGGGATFVLRLPPC